MGQADAVRVPLFFVEVEAEGRAFVQLFAILREHTHPQFRALKVSQNADGSTGFLFDLADDAVFVAYLFVAAMAHIQPEDIRPGAVQGRDHFPRGGSRPQGGHDLYVPHPSHVISSSTVTTSTPLCAIDTIGDR